MNEHAVINGTPLGRASHATMPIKTAALFDFATRKRSNLRCANATCRKILLGERLRKPNGHSTTWLLPYVPDCPSESATRVGRMLPNNR